MLSYVPWALKCTFRRALRKFLYYYYHHRFFNAQSAVTVTPGHQEQNKQKPENLVQGDSFCICMLFYLERTNDMVRCFCKSICEQGPAGYRVQVHGIHTSVLADPIGRDGPMIIGQTFTFSMFCYEGNAAISCWCL